MHLIINNMGAVKSFRIIVGFVGMLWSFSVMGQAGNAEHIIKLQPNTLAGAQGLTMAAVEGSLRQRQLIDEGWKFHFGDAADPARDFNFSLVSIFAKSGKAAGTAIAPDCPDSGWRTLQLPHDWAVELPFENSPDQDVMAHGYKP